MGDAQSSLEAQYFYSYACQTDDERTPVRASFEAWRNYWNAINEIFHDQDLSIEQVVEQMQDAQDALRSTRSPSL